MDNRINEIRRKISSLRAEMMDVEAAVRDQINHDLDCTEASLRLMAKRAELLVLLGEWKAAGGSDRLPTVEERLKENHRPPEKRHAQHRRPPLKVSLGRVDGPESGAA